MPSLKCKCGKRLNFGEIPNPIEWLAISDSDYDAYSGKIDSEVLYKDMKSVLECPSCRRLWAFCNGFQNDPICYIPEK